MSRINHGYIVSLTILLFASEHVMSQSDSLPTPVASAKNSANQGIDNVRRAVQPFLPSLNDVIQKPGDLTGTAAHVCQLNPPMTKSPDLTRKSCRLNHDSMTKKYCIQMTDLLLITLKGSENNPQAQRRAIETALRMVSENAIAVSEARIDELEVEQERLIVQMSRYINRASDQSQLFEQYKTWLQPIYYSQNRTHEQLIAISTSHESLKKTIDRLEQQITHSVKKAEVSDPVVLTEPTSLRNQPKTHEKAQSLDAEELQKQLEVLRERIKKLHKSPIRPASHLEPIYSPQQQLEPLLNMFKR